MVSEVVALERKAGGRLTHSATVVLPVVFFLLPLLVISSSQMIATVWPPRSQFSLFLTLPFLFVGLVIIILRLLAQAIRIDPPPLLRRRQLALSLTGFLIFSSVLDRSPSTIPVAIAVFVMASSEELIFREILPRALQQSLASFGVGAVTSIMLSVITVQLSFAAAHFLARPSFVWLVWHELLRLFVIGMLYHELMQVCGLGVVSAVHAMINYLIEARAESQSPISEIVLTLSLIVAIALLTRRAIGAAPKGGAFR